MKNDELCLVESAGQKASELRSIGEKPVESAAYAAPGFDTPVILAKLLPKLLLKHVVSDPQRVRSR